MAFSFGMMALTSSGARYAYVRSGEIDAIKYYNNSEHGLFMGGVFIALFLACILSTLWVCFMSKLASKIVFATLFFAMAVTLICGVTFFATGFVAGGLFYLLLSICAFFFFVFIRKRIEFATAMLTVACDAILAMPFTIIYSFGAIGVQLVWCVVWIMATLGVATNEASKTIQFDGTSYSINSCTSFSYSSDFVLSSSTTLPCTSGKCVTCVCGGIPVKNAACFIPSINIGAYLLLLVSLFWTCSVISNVVHITTAGAVSNWWHREVPSPSIVRKSFVRAVTSSFGSLCLGSLLVAVIRGLRIVVETIAYRFGLVPQHQSTSFLQRYISGCLDYCLRALDWLLNYFNKYAFCYVAIYGYTYMDSSRAVVGLFRDRGWTAIVNDEITDTVLSLSHMVVGAVCLAVCHLYAKGVGLSSADSVLLSTFGALVGYLMCTVTMKVISSAVATTFVCYAESPEALLGAHPERYRELAAAWRKFYPDASPSDDVPVAAAAPPKPTLPYTPPNLPALSAESRSVGQEPESV